jgi:ABC-type Fe3+-siderophore transport system permease subunit
MSDHFEDKGSVGSGIGVTALLHLLQIPIGMVLYLMNPAWSFFTVIFFGVSQVVYMIPAILYFRKQGKTETTKGLIIGASVSFLLNATCTAIVFSSLRL